MNHTAAFEAGLKMLAEIRTAAAIGDEYAKKLLKGYETCNPAVLGMPWPNPTKETRRQP